MAALRGYTVGFRTWTMMYLATIAFLPYPAATFGRYPDNPVAVSLLAVAASAVSTMEAILFWSTFRGDLFARRLSASQARRALAALLTPVAVFLLSIPVAFAIHPLAAVVKWFVGPILSSLPGHRSPDV